jgi:hypothetical protein
MLRATLPLPVTATIKINPFAVMTAKAKSDPKAFEKLSAKDRRLENDQANRITPAGAGFDFYQHQPSLQQDASMSAGKSSAAADTEAIYSNIIIRQRKTKKFKYTDDSDEDSNFDLEELEFEDDDVIDPGEEARRNQDIEKLAYELCNTSSTSDFNKFSILSREQQAAECKQAKHEFREKNGIEFEELAKNISALLMSALKPSSQNQYM